MTFDQHRLEGGLISGVPELGDIGAGDEAVRLRRTNDEAARALLLDLVESGIELGQRRLIEGVGAGVVLVEQEPRDVVLVGMQPPVLPRAGIAIRAVDERAELEIAWAQDVKHRLRCGSFAHTASHHLDQHGTTLTANLTKALGTQRNLTGLEMTLKRSFSFKGRRHSYISAGCPAPKGVPILSFPLARTSFAFAGNIQITETLNKTCKPRG